MDNSFFNNDLNIRGELLIEVLDQDTLEVKRFQEEENTLTRLGMIRLSLDMGLDGRNTSLYGNSTADSESTFNNAGSPFQSYDLGSGLDWGRTTGTDVQTRMLISGHRFHNDAYSCVVLPGAIGANSVLNAGSISGSGTTLSPHIYTFKHRFNAPGSARTIWTVALADVDNTPLTLAALTSSCSQGATEIVDITYRIIFSYNSNSMTGNALPVSPAAPIGKAMRNVRQNGNKSVSMIRFMPNKMHDYKNYEYWGWGVHWATNNNKASVIQAVPFKGRISNSFGVNDHNGMVIQSVYTRTHPDYINSRHSNFGIMDILGNASFTNKPIQPIFSHSSTSNIPLMDVNNLASSLGGLSVSGANWQETPIPEFYTLQYTATGDMSQGKYMFYTRHLTGFNGNSYQGVRTYSAAFTDNDAGLSYYGLPNYTFKGMHGSSKRTMTLYEEYDKYKFVLWDNTGITISDITDGTAVNFDATTTPALPVTGILQTATNFSNGDVWVACRDTGLYRIQDPFGTPVITKINTIDAFTSVSNAYGVALGYNNSIWCAINGAIAKSTDNGATWTAYNTTTSPALTATGITNNNWHRIRFIRVDITSPNDELAIIFGDNDTFTNYKLCFWSQNLTGSILSPILGTPSQSVVLNRYWCAKCCPHTGVWMLGIYESHFGENCRFYTYKFNASFMNLNSDDIMPLSGSQLRRIHDINYNLPVVYDYYGIPHFIVNQRNHNINYYALKDIRGQKKGIMRAFSTIINGSSTTDTTNTHMNTHPYLGSYSFNAPYNKSPMFYISNWSDTWGTSPGAVAPSPIGGGFTDIWPSSNYRETEAMTSGGITSNGFSNDYVNGKYSPFSEIVVNKMHWNPNTSQWQKDYYAPAIDSSANNVNGIRHNFDTDSHTFTGRSLIDITDSFANGDVNNVATFAFTVNSFGKLTGVNQELAQTLLSIDDELQMFRVQFADSSNASFIIQHTTTNQLPTNNFTIGARPNLNEEHRIIIVLDGTSVSVYINGIQFGSTITLASSFNFSAPTTKFRAYIGAEVYYRTWGITQPFPNAFFRGTIKNAQMWNVAWDVTAVSNDYTDITSVITDYPSTNLIARYQLTEPLIESKPTHTSVDALNNGITIAFTEDVDNPSYSFVETDYYTFGVVNGILKDNATSFNHTFDFYGYLNVNADYSEFFNSTGGNTITIDPNPITTPIHWIGRVSNDLFTDTSCGQAEFFGSGTTTIDNHTVSIETISGDGEFSFKPSSTEVTGIAVGINSAMSHIANNTNLGTLNFAINFTNNTTAAVFESNTQRTTTPYVFGDKFTIRRVGTVVTYYKNDVLFYTSLVSSTGTFAVKAMLAAAQNVSKGIVEATITYTNPRAAIYAGNLQNLTGCFSKRFIQVESSPASTIKLKIDGIDAPATISNTVVHTTTIPSPGSVVLNPYSGMFVFHPDDVGKTVTGTCVLIKDN
jgi:hypothetical protein